MTLENWLQEQQLKFSKVITKDQPLAEAVERVEKLRSSRIEKIANRAAEKKPKENAPKDKITVFAKLKELIQKTPVSKNSGLNSKLTASGLHSWISETELPGGISGKAILAVTKDEQAEFQKTIQEELNKILQ